MADTHDSTPDKGPAGKALLREGEQRVGEERFRLEMESEIAERKRILQDLEFKNLILSTQQETSLDGILVVDGNNNILSYNRRFADLWGIPHESVKCGDDAPVLRLVSSKVADPTSFVSRIKYLYEQKEEKSHEEIVLKDGKVFDRYSAPMLGADGKYFGRIWYFQDITERKRTAEEIYERNALLQESNSRLQALYEVSQVISRTLEMDKLLLDVLHTLVKARIFPFGIQAAIYLVEENRVTLASFVNLSELTVEPCKVINPGKCLCGQAVATGEVITSPDTSKDNRYPSCSPETGPPHGRIVVPLKAGDMVVGLLSLYVRPGIEITENLLQLLNSLGIQVGIAISNVNLYEEIKSISLHDPLTGLANRRFMDIQLEKNFYAAKRYGGNLSVIMLDIDHFKRYNDTRGHQEGDRLLVRLAQILMREMRKSDYIFRYGGEEFLAMLPGMDQAMACKAAERFRAAVEEEAGVTISLGVASCRESMPDKETMIAGADAALYRAKERGRNRVEGAV